MKTMNIKDPDVYDAARRLADLRGTTLTGAVRSAVEEALDAELKKRAGARAQVAELQAEVAATVGQPVSDSELYDEAGLPL